MQKISICICLFLFLTTSCTKEGEKILAAFDVYCEMVANEAKPLALHYPMGSEEIEHYWSDFQKISKKRGVKLFKEDEFPETLLFPSGIATGKTVVLIYKENSLEQYHQLKKDIVKSDQTNLINQISLTRRFGRLLGYSPTGINKLISKNSKFRTVASTNVKAQKTHLYYEDINEAIDFYENKLGLKKENEATFQISQDAYIVLHPHNESHAKGQTKSTAIALLTDQLPEWYTYIQEQNIPIKYTYKPKEGGPHDGFVAIDPGGYLLEFEQFKQHPENELFMAVLSSTERMKTKIQDLNFYGSITWTYHNDLLRLQNFYQDELGFKMVADQGWTKIFQTSSSGFIGLVDERRGMESYDDTKAVEIEWKVGDQNPFEIYANQFWSEYEYKNGSFIGPELYKYHITN